VATKRISRRHRASSMTGTNSTKTAKQIVCANCGEPTTAGKRVTLDGNVYCRKLCAGVGLIQIAHDEDGIDPELAIDTLTTLVERSLGEDPVPIPTRVRDCDSEAFVANMDPDDRRFIVVINDDGIPDWVPAPGDDYSRKKAKIIPQAKILRFTPTGKSVPVPAQEVSDDQLLQAHFGHITIEPELRESLVQFYREQFPEDFPPAAS
jgi:hypothetical protein